MKQLLKYVFRILLFVIVLFILLHKIDTQSLWKAFSHVRIDMTVAALLLYYMKYALMAWRWKMSCIAHGRNIPLKTLAPAQVEIAFLEIIFPVPDSEDAFRIIHMHSRNYSISESLAIALYDRMVGVAILFFILPFTLLAFGSVVFKQYEISGLALLAAVSFGMLAVTFHRSILKAAILLVEKYLGKNLSFLEGMKNELVKNIPLYIVIQSILLAFMYAACGTLAPWLLVQAFGAEVSFLSLVAAIPLFYISAILPLSLQGLGLYEAALVFILQLCSVEKETALAIGMIHFLFHIAVIFTGGILHLINPAKTNLETAVALFSNRLFKGKLQKQVP